MKTKTKINPNALPFGLIRFAINCTVTEAKEFTQVAKTKREAWNKFVTQAYRNSPLKPNRKDWTVKPHKNQNKEL